jgi:diphthamide biosynthesis protein 2
MTYSCCVDIVSCEHYDADCVVHFGHSCLSAVDKLPVYYVFDKYELDVDSFVSQVNLLLSSNSSNNDTNIERVERLFILYDVAYYYLIGWLSYFHAFLDKFVIGIF